MKKKKLVGVVAVALELLVYCVFLGRIATKNPGMFLIGLFFYLIPGLISILGVYVVAVAFIDGECREAKATGIGILSFGLIMQILLFSITGAVEPSMALHYTIIAIGSFGMGQYIFALFTNNHRPGSDFGS